jgi:hypothetical protein
VTARLDGNGNVHGEDGRFVSLRDYVESIFAEREKQMERVFAERESSAEFKRLALKEALDEARRSTERALAEAKDTVQAALQEAKTAADKALAEAKGAAVSAAEVNRHRIELLESGGAPFASRLDESLTLLKQDVDVLKENMVRTTVLDALREQTIEEAKAQKRQIKYVFITAAIALALSLVEGLVRAFG